MGQEVVLHDNAELHKATLHAKQITLDNNILTKVITTPPLDSHYDTPRHEEPMQPIGRE